MYLLNGSKGEVIYLYDYYDLIGNHVLMVIKSIDTSSVQNCPDIVFGCSFQFCTNVLFLKYKML